MDKSRTRAIAPQGKSSMILLLDGERAGQPRSLGCVRLLRHGVEERRGVNDRAVSFQRQVQVRSAAVAGVIG